MRTTIITAMMLVISLGTGIGIAAAPMRSESAYANPALRLADSSRISPGPSNQHEKPIPQSDLRPSSGSLSDQLSRSGGVIHPPASGDHAVIAPPNQRTSRTPIVPPPGTPGGNPLIQPK